MPPDHRRRILWLWNFNLHPLNPCNTGCDIINTELDKEPHRKW